MIPCSSNKIVWILNNIAVLIIAAAKFPNYQQTISYPDFTANTIQASACVSLDHTYWELQGKALLAISCSTQRTDLKGNNRYGVIGMGTQGSSKGNFLKSKTFSVHFPSLDVKNGTLKFSPKELDGFYFLTYFTTNANWVVPMRGYIQTAGFSEGFTGSMIFDINADAIGFPPRLFEIFIRSLEEKEWMQGLSCTRDIFQPTCNYTGYIRDLTEIDISAGQPQNNSRRFDIKPELYVLNAKSKDDYVYSITLNLQALNSSFSSGKSYVTADYENTIVLDARAMSYFYLIFNATGNTNTISVYDVSGILPNGTSPDSIFNLSKYSRRDFVIIGFILIVSLTVSCAVLKRCGCNKAGTIQASPVIIVDNSTTIVNAGMQNNFYQQQPQGVQYIPPHNIGYIYQENQHL